jgi:flagellar hook-associated protein FlgK
MPDSLLIGLSALQTHKRAMEVTSHNLANATTTGYSRQRTDLVAPTPEDNNPGQIGRGVEVEGIRRIIDSLTDERLRASTSEVSRLKTLSDTLKNVELSFNEPGDNGLSGVTNNLFNVLSDLSNNPESGALRSAAMQELQTWTSTVNDLSQRLTQMRDDIRKSVDDQVTGVNQLTEQIANLNQQIRRQTLSGNSPNDLLDSRDQMVNELSGYLDVNVRRNATDGSVTISAGGVQLVGSDSANKLTSQIRSSGGIAILTPNGGVLRPQGGSLSALNELDQDILPGLVGKLDTLTTTVAHRLNELHATATSQAMQVNSFQSSFTIPTANLQTNLDDAQLTQIDSDGPGIPDVFRPSFTDAAGNLTARNLTINERDTASGVANKYTLRYDPATGTGSRSLLDLVQAINSGSGGGFTVIPGNAIGIPDVQARAVAVDGGYQLQISASSGKTIDFSPALDQQPGSGDWSGPQVQVSSVTAIPASVGDRLQFEVEQVALGSPDLQIRITSRNPSDGTSVTHGIVALAAAPAVVSVPDIGGIGFGQLDIDLGAGAYRAGDRFVVELDNGGAVKMKGSASSGIYIQDPEVTAGDASFALRGRYTGALGLEPSGGSPPYTTWSMRVISTGTAAVGTIGAKISSVATDPQPPVVEFSYWSGASGSPTLETVRRTLDDKLPPGTPVQIADGVYAVFNAGSLSVSNPGEGVHFTVDAQPDQAELLSGLGIGGIFTGSTAANLQVDQRLVDDPTQLNVGLTRSEGDNSNVLRLMAARNEKLFGNGSFALDDTYNSILSDIGVRIQQSGRLNENQSNIQAALENQRQQVSGVNIDEEVGMLILQQQAYSAAARIITFARENIQTLLDLAR